MLKRKLVYLVKKSNYKSYTKDKTNPNQAYNKYLLPN